MIGNMLNKIKALKESIFFQKNKTNCAHNINKKVAKYWPVIENICIKLSCAARAWEKLFHEKPVKIFPLKNSPIEIQAAREIVLINFVSQKIVGIIKLGDAKISNKKGKTKRIIYLNEDNSGLYSKA